MNQAPPPSLCNSKTNWGYFRYLISTNLTLHVPLQTDSHIDEAVKYFNETIQWAGWIATPETSCTPSFHTCSIFIKQKIAEQRRLRWEWQRNRTPMSKKLLNRASQDLKQLLRDHKNAGIQTFLLGLTPTASTDYSLWKTTKKLKTVTPTSTPIRTSHGTWARTNAEKAQVFTQHLASVFTPHPPPPQFRF
jgi:hypothetical protein